MKKFLVIFVYILSVAVIIRANGINEILKIMAVSMKDIRYCIIHMGLTFKDFIKMQELLQEEDISEGNIKKYLTNYSCFITCALEKSHIIQNDEIQLDKLVEMANRKNISIDVKMLSECINANKSTDKCENGLNFIICFSKLLSDMYEDTFEDTLKHKSYV
ncbi:odorant binding protein 7 [Apis mellifera caucasica]|uniref:OBP7 n=1 Tax=Apis mellifera TaxID=7460 RepID=A0A8U1BXF7_APIME|nr:odorant binding protein 7 [Apis mellifera]ABD92640.1 OBP7 [Apis mellifera]KAG6801068.1 odorant binding protein 7 [Apis mellifera caucasica]KAG9430901.1 odorant binding protein 7 [Apis mellifera carnica]|eukprot:NP_001035310.1 odorant binding protein 7 [Apis mellifera]